MELVEREPLLAALHRAHAAAAAGRGGVVFVAGEAGAGKSALVARFCSELPASTTVRRGYCDALTTPRALGPVLDVAGTGLADAVLRGDRHTLFTAVLDLIGGALSVTVIEDAHWADEATLDLLLFLGRRVADSPASIVVTYRAEDVGRDHPLRRVLGDLATVRSVTRLDVPPLTPSAVAALAEAADRDGAAVHAVTGGNAFFVTEVLQAPGTDVPPTVRDAVLARVARLSAPTRAVLDVVALIPDRAEIDLVDEVAGAGATGDAVDECVRAGMLVIDGAAVRFRHELARRGIEAEVPPATAVRLHRRILAALAAADTADPARLAYHADAAHDDAATRRWAEAAGGRAALLGAHREAAAHFAKALDHSEATPDEHRAGLWEALADAADRGGELAAAIDASARAAQLWHAVGDREREAGVLARRSHVLSNLSRVDEARETARAAVALVEPLPPGVVLAQALAAQARQHMLEHDNAAAIATGSAAAEHAERLGDRATLGRALAVVGSAQWSTDPERAEALLRAGLDATRSAGDAPGVATALNNLGSGAAGIRRYALAHHWLAESVAWCAERDLDFSHGYGMAWIARCHFEQGRWGEATATASEVVDRFPEHAPSQMLARTVIGGLRTRRGDPDTDASLDTAWELADRAGLLQRVWPVAAARAERAWLTGTPDRIEGMVAQVYRRAVDAGHGWAAGELGYWLHVAGTRIELPPFAARPFALQVAGDAEAASTAWRELGCPYEAALALATAADDPDVALVGLQELQDMGASAAAELCARGLRERGVRHIPRGPRPATVENPGGLTGRQVDVVRLLAQGLRNSDIATALHLSPKTVDHHVSAILAKLGVGSRAEAAQWARRLPDLG